jgi:serine protease AprX
MPQEQPIKQGVTQSFNPKLLDRTVVAIPLIRAVADIEDAEEWMSRHRSRFAANEFNAVIFLARNYPEGPTGAVKQVKQLLEQVLDEVQLSPEHNRILQEAPKARENRRFVVAQLERPVRLALVDRDRKEEFPAIDRLRANHFDVIIDVNLQYPYGSAEARKWLVETLENTLLLPSGVSRAELKQRGTTSTQHLFARMHKEHIYALLEKDAAHSQEIRNDLNRQRSNERDTQEPASSGTCRAIHSIWPDFPIKPCITNSIACVKADAALNSFSTLGTGITWAVIDSGIDAKHPHFEQGHNLDSLSPLHRDFTSNASPDHATALQDAFGHGTHVAGIIAGGFDSDRDKQNRTLNSVRRVRVKATAQESDVEKVVTPLHLVRGMAPKCQLVSLKVLDDVGFGEVSNVITALSYILDINDSGRAELKIHGVNISLGYEIEPEWFACGESPICIEVNRVVRSGVVVVVAIRDMAPFNPASAPPASAWP